MKRMVEEGAGNPHGITLNKENDYMQQTSQNMSEFLGRVNIGWTIGEETLFDSTKNDIRKESVYSETDSCLLGINKTKLSLMQKQLLDSGNSKDYFVIESTLKGNNLIKK